MTPIEFRAVLQQKADIDLLDLCLREEEPPFAFETRPVSWNEFRDSLVSSLGVLRSDIRVVGSARLGFSLKPHRRLQAFNDKSDIDVVVVNADLFDDLWIKLLAAAYPRPPMVDKIGGWLKRARNELYTGWVNPPKIRLDRKIFGTRGTPILELRTQWFNALKEASRYPARRHEDVQGRLYRTWAHAELYHLHSLAELRRSLGPGE